MSEGSTEQVLPGKPAHFVACGNACGELDKFVIQKRNAALDGGSHAHLVLFHQKLDQIRLDVEV